MQPEKYKAKVMKYGLYEGMGYMIKKDERKNHEECKINLRSAPRKEVADLVEEKVRRQHRFCLC